MALFGENTALEIVIKARNEATKVIQGVEKDFKRVGESLERTGRDLTTRLSLPIAAAAGFAVKAAVDYESAFAGVRKTVDATEEEFRQFSDALRQASKEMPISANELAGIAEISGQLGVGVADLEKFTKTVAQLGVTTNLSGEQAAVALARVANVMQEPLQNIDRMGAVVVDLGNNFATTEAEIAEFGNRIAGAGKIAGLATSDVFAIGAALSSVGVQAEAGGTAVQKVLLSLNEAVITSSDKLNIYAKTAGMSASEFAKSWRDDAGKAFTKFVEGLGTQGENAIFTLQELGLEDMRLVRSFLSLANAGDLMSRALGKGSDAWSENTALTAEAEKRFKTTASQLKILWNRVIDLGVTIGNLLLPAITAAANGLGKAIPYVEKLATWFSKLPKPVQITAGAIAALAVVLPPLIMAAGIFVSTLGMLAPVLTAVTAGVGMLGTALAFLAANPIILLIAAIAFAAFMIVKHWDKIKFAWDATVDWLSDKMLAFAGFWKDVWTSIGDGLSAAWETIKTIVATSLAFIVGAIALALDTIFPNWQQNLQMMADAWTLVWNTMKDTLTLLWETITNYLGDKIYSVSTFIETQFNRLSSVIAAVLEGIRNVWERVWGAVKDFFIAIWQPIKDAVRGALDFILEKIEAVIRAWEKMKATVSAPVNAAIGGVQNFVGSAIQRGKSLLGFEHGGIVPTPKGQPTPIMAHGQERIIPANQRGTGGGITVNLNISNLQIRDDNDMDVLTRKIEDVFRGLMVNHKIEIA